ncbi:MAG: Gfo/Idh/MocA family oxidoreductase [Planctomycetes bacterium]|nr:Gfo/Idh/MocA family oxidoreductase [Planctomycetota bacterium]
MPVKIGIIGGGKFGEMHLRAFIQLQREGRAELVGLADINKDLLKSREEQYGVKGFTDYMEMIRVAKPDAVSVATPDFLHRKIAVDALRAGRHVLVEKPLDVTVAGCQEMIKAAQAKKLLLQVDFHKRYDPYHQELAKNVAAGKLGEIEYGYAWMEDRIEVPRDWFPGWAPKSSPGWFLGVHMYDLIRWIIKSNGAQVSATGVKKRLKGLGVDTYDSIQAKILFESGASFTVDSSWILPDGFEAIVNQGIRMVGTEGIMEVDSQNRGAESCFSGKNGGMATYNLGFFKEGKDKSGRTYFRGYGIESIQDFALNVNHLLEGGKLADLKDQYADGVDGLEVTKIAVAVHKSADAGGKVIKLKDLR